MSLEQVHADLESYINSADLAGFPLTFNNVGDCELSLGSANFARACVDFLQAVRFEVNPNPHTREDGVLTFDIYIPQDTGSRDVYKFLDKADAAVLHKTRAGVYFTERRKVGEYKVGKWAVYTFLYPFIFCG